MRRVKNVILLFTGILLAAALSCSSPPDSYNGDGSQTGNAMIAGMLYLHDGQTPAAHVTLHIRRKSTLADTSVRLYKTLADSAATVTTNDAGAYAVDSISPGLYVIEGSKDSDAVLIDSIAVESRDSTITVPPDTLKPAGAIKGVIRLSEGGDPRKVFILAFGIDRFAKVNVDGSFRFSTLAEGVYDLRMISGLDDYGVLDTNNIAVKSADTSDLDTMDLPFTGIPTPKNVDINYDTLKQIVTVRWSKPDSNLVKGFTVYRRNVDSNTVLKQINTSPITDTLYRDSAGIQDMTYEYRVAGVDKNATEGTKSAGVSVKIVGAYAIADTLFTAGGNINAAILDKNGNYLVVRYVTPYSSPAKIERYGKQGKFINAWDIPNGIVYSYVFNNIAVDDSNFIYVINASNSLIKFDSTGAILKQSQYPGTARGFTIFKDTVYFGNTVANKVFAYSTKGDSLFSWGEKGFTDGHFENITTINCDSIGQIYVEDALGFGRIQVFDRNGAFIRSFNFKENAVTNGATDLIVTQLDIRDSSMLVTGSNVYSYNLNGTMQFIFFSIPSPNRAFFDSVGDIVIALWSGEVVRLKRN